MFLPWFRAPARSLYSARENIFIVASRIRRRAEVGRSSQSITGSQAFCFLIFSCGPRRRLPISNNEIAPENPTSRFVIARICKRKRDNSIDELFLSSAALPQQDRKSTRLNSSHEWISYAVFCLKKKKKK